MERSTKNREKAELYARLKKHIRQLEQRTQHSFPNMSENRAWMMYRLMINECKTRCLIDLDCSSILSIFQVTVQSCSSIVQSVVIVSMHHYSLDINENIRVDCRSYVGLRIYCS
jgi:hypothetical protein